MVGGANGIQSPLVPMAAKLRRGLISFVGPRVGVCSMEEDTCTDLHKGFVSFDDPRVGVCSKEGSTLRCMILG